MYKVLFVCSGATCRSPMASSLFNKKVKEHNLSGVKSEFCGMFVEYGSQVNSYSKQALKEYGIKRVCGEPTQITGKQLAENNLIVCLTEDHKEALINISASKFKDKITSFKDICGQDIFDPYGKDLAAYQRCLALIDKGLENLITILLNSKVVKYKRSRNV